MKRREFLERTVYGTAGIAIGAYGLGANSCKGANDKVVTALIGAGNWGVASIIGACRFNDGIEIKTVCDVDDRVAASAANEINEKLGYIPAVTSNMKEVFDDREVDAVWISTPDHWHALATVWACQAGKHVFVEKTPSNSILEGRKMIEAAKKYRCTVQVGFQNRSAGYARSAREYIQTGKLGQVVHVRIFNLLPGRKWEPVDDTGVPEGLDWDLWLGPASYRPYNQGVHRGWSNFPDFSAGTLNEASHQIDLARMVMGDPGHPKSVYCWGGNNIWNSERDIPELQSVTFDFEKFTMTCETGDIANYMSKTPNLVRNDISRFPDWRLNSTRIEIYGTEGLMYLGRMGGGWQVYGPGEEIVAEEGGLFPGNEHQKNFIDAIRTRTKPNSGIEQAHHSATLVHLANIAFRTGNRQLLFDSVNESFIDNKEADGLLRCNYRGDYVLPESV